MRASLSVVVLLAGVGYLVAKPRPVLACKPAPNHSVRLLENDAPACAGIEIGLTHGEATLRIDNQCEEAFSLRVDDCPGCRESITLLTGQQATMVIEHREQVSRAALSWSLGDMTGRLLADVDWQDNSNACDGHRPPKRRLGCSIHGGGRTGPGSWGAGLLLVAGLRLWSRR